MFLKELPVPIFLGLDRTTLPGTNAREEFRIRGRSRFTRARPTLRAFLDESVAQAESLVAKHYKVAQRERTKLAGALREDILLALFAERQGKPARGALPTGDDVRKLERTRRSLKQAFSVLGLPASRVESVVDPFFSQIINVGEKIKDKKNINEILSDDNEEEQAYFFSWINKRPILSILDHIEYLVTAFSDKESEIFWKINEYKSLLMDFFSDSGKSIEIDDDGVKLLLPSGTKGNIFQTASGERQLFVLITNLMFNNDENQANILIIDEPELSLHLKWQEMFVMSLRRANSDTQIILATHSPSIIMNDDNKCIDLAC